MKKFRLLVIGMVLLTLGILIARTANAQATITVSPAQLSVAGTRGAVETRTLLIRATEPITSLHAIPLDLARTGGDAVLPAGAIQASLPTDEIAPDAPLTVPVTFDLHTAPGGEFSGALLLGYHGGALTVPVTVTVKDPWPMPLTVLVVGVALGMGVSAYRAQGRPRDEVLVRVGQLRAQMRSDADLAQPFRAQIEAHVVDVEAALRAEKWDTAQSGVEQAEAVWLRWRKGRTDWLAQLAYRAELEQRLEDLNANVPYVQAVRRALEDTVRDAPGLEGPDQLRGQLVGLARQINRYAELDVRLDELDRTVMQLPVQEMGPWQRKSLDLRRRLERLAPDDDPAYQALQSEVEQAIAEVEEAVAKLAPPGATARGLEMVAKGMSGVAAIPLRLLAPAPSARPLTMEERVTGARTRLWWFTRTSYIIAVALLAGAGFGELYVANAAFGANPWGDYFALLAWGFGAEATRAAVTEMVRGWGLPGVE